MYEGFWSIVGCIAGGILVVLLVLLIQKFRKKKDESLKDEGVLWNYFFFAVGNGGLVVSFNYFVKVVFTQGAFPPRPEDVLYGFMCIFAFKMMVDSVIFIRKVRAKYKQNTQAPVVTHEDS